MRTLTLPIISFLKLNPDWVIIGPVLLVAITWAAVYYWAWRRERAQGQYVQAAIDTVTSVRAAILAHDFEPVANAQRLADVIHSMVLSTTGRSRVATLLELMRLAKDDPTAMNRLEEAYPPQEFRKAAKLFAQLFLSGRENGTYAEHIAAVGLGLRPPHLVMAELTQSERRQILEKRQPQK